MLSVVPKFTHVSNLFLSLELLLNSILAYLNCFATQSSIGKVNYEHSFGNIKRQAVLILSQEKPHISTTRTNIAKYCKMNSDIIHLNYSIKNSPRDITVRVSLTNVT